MVRKYLMDEVEIITPAEWTCRECGHINPHIRIWGRRPEISIRCVKCKIGRTPQ